MHIPHSLVYAHLSPLSSSPFLHCSLPPLSLSMLLSLLSQSFMGQFCSHPAGFCVWSPFSSPPANKETESDFQVF